MDSIRKGTFDKSIWVHGISFFLCFFVFQLAEFLINDKASYIMGQEGVNKVYSVGIACTALGFLSFSLIYRVCKGDKKRRRAITVIGALAILFTALFLNSKEVPIFLLSSFLLLTALGSICGCIYYTCAMCFEGKKYTGRVIGISMCFAVVLQFIVQNLLVVDIVFFISMVLSIAVLMYIALKPSMGWVLENQIQYSHKDEKKDKRAVTIILAVVFMTLVVSLIDGVVVSKHAQGELSVSSYSRLFYAASLITAGFISDIKNRKYLCLCTVCTMFISTVATAFMSDEGTFFLGVSLMYTYSGFYVMFLTLGFFDFALKTKRPELWAGMGRVCRGFVTAVTAVPVVHIFNRLGTLALIAGSCIFSVIVLLILLKEIIRDMSHPLGDAGSTERLSGEEALRLYGQDYNFTEREQEVFERLIITEDGNQKIADELFVSRRVLQRYIASIYEKTSTKSRIGLYQSYTEFIAKKQGF